MKNRLVSAALLGLALPALAGAQVATDWKKIGKAPLPKFEIPKPTRAELPNGITVLLMEDHELPLVSATLIFRAGDVDVPAAKAGLADLLGNTWRAGGSAKMSGDELDEWLEKRAAAIETGVSDESASVSFDCLKQDFPDVLKVFAELVRAPRFSEDKLVIAKNQANSGIARRNDDPHGVAVREANRLGYGPGTPYGRMSEYATIAAVTRQDLVDFHAKMIRPNGAVLGVSGDFDSKKMMEALRGAFGDWKKGADTKRELPAYQPSAPGFYSIERSDVNQTSLIAVAPGIRRNDPDYHSIEVLNEVFGGGFAARLFSNIRTKKGLAYHVGGGIGSNYSRPGMLQLSLQTKSTTTGAGWDALKEEIENIVKSPATPEELARAKESILNSFVFQFDSPEKVLHQQMTYAFHGYPADFLSKYQAGIEKVTAADVARVAKKWISADKMAVVILGKPSEYDRPLSTFGKVTKIDTTIPEPGGGAASTAASPEAAAKGKALAAKVVASLGGETKLAALRSTKATGKLTAQTPMGAMDMKIAQTTLLPGSVRSELETPMGKIVMVVAPAGAFMQMGPQSQDMPGSQREEIEKDLKRASICVARNASKATFAAAGGEKVGEIAAEMVDVTNEGVSFRWWVDPASGKILRARYKSVGEEGPVESTVDYSDYREMDGMWIPFKESTTQDGKEQQALVLESWSPNVDVPADAFTAPAKK